MIDVLAELIILTFVTAGICSCWLHSILFCELNNNWWYYWEAKRNKYLRKMSKLATCPICSSFWIAMFCQHWIVEDTSLLVYFLLSIGVAFTSWLLISQLELNYHKTGRAL
jgi:hypothetical protein